MIKVTQRDSCIFRQSTMEQTYYMIFACITTNCIVCVGNNIWCSFLFPESECDILFIVINN